MSSVIVEVEADDGTTGVGENFSFFYATKFFIMHAIQHQLL